MPASSSRTRSECRSRSARDAAGDGCSAGDESGRRGRSKRWKPVTAPKGLEMPDIVLYTLVSLDGATEDPHRYFPETGDRPGAPVFDEELARLEAEMIAR